MVLNNFRCDVGPDIRIHHAAFTYTLGDESMQGGQGRGIRYLGACAVGENTGRCAMMQPAREEEDWILVRLDD